MRVRRSLFRVRACLFLHRFNSHTSDSKVRSQLEHYRLRSLAAASATVCAHGKRHQWNTHVTCHVTQTHRTPKYYSTAQILFLFFFPLPAKWAIRWHTFQIKNIEYCTDCKRDTACPLRSGKRMTMRYDMIETHAQRGHVYMYEDVL